MTWRLATSLSTLRAEINAAYPNRDKASDGTIGDAAHATRNSDHNPWIIDGHGVGVVRAFDCDEDLLGAGKTPDPSPLAAIAERIRQMGEAGDRRLADWGYVIYEGRIAGGNPSRPNRWTWRPYSGSNAHRIHMHVSVSRNQAGYDDPTPWNVATTPTPPAPDPEEDDMFTDDDRKKLDACYEQLTVSRDDKAKGGPTVRWLLAKANDRIVRLLGR